MRPERTQASKAGEQPRSGRVLADLQAQLFALNAQDDLGVLGLDRTADDEQVRQAYLALAQRFHPHRFARYRSTEISRVASDIFVRIQTAYGRLTGSHKIPLATRSAPRTVRTRADVVTSEAADLLQYHQYDAAIAQLNAVLESEPSHVDAYTWLHIARARKHKTSGNSASAITAYRKVLERRPDHAEALAELERLAIPKETSLLKRLFKLGG
jgi:tetratricopeptide (TPR) repeat protein